MSEVVKETTSIVLPKTRAKASRKSPRKLIIFSPPKVGKTTCLAGLDNNLILDLENGSEFVDAMKINIDSLATLRAVGEQIKAEGRPYRYVTVDTVTVLEDMVKPLALKNYQATPIGKNYNGDILNLPQGAGYGYLRSAFFSVLDYVETLADNIILVGHQKDKLIEVNSKEVTAKSLDLVGKLASLVCADADAIGILQRKDNQTILNFKTLDTIICGARPEHLRNKEIVIAEQQEDGTIQTFWDKVYVD